MTFSHPVQGHQTRPPCPQADLRGPTGGNVITPPPAGGKGPPAALRPAARRTQARGLCKSRTPNTSGPSWPQGAQSRSPCCLWVRLLLYSPQNPFPRHQALVMPASLPPSSPEAHLLAPTPARCVCTCARVLCSIHCKCQDPQRLDLVPLPPSGGSENHHVPQGWEMWWQSGRHSCQGGLLEQETSGAQTDRRTSLWWKP